MHITIVTVGSRGDVQPYVALGLGLKHAGHQVQIITDGLFADFIQKAGLDFAPIQADPRKALEEDVRKLGSNPVKVLSWINAQFKPLAIQVTQDVYHACKHTDAVVYSNLAFAAFHVAEAYQLPSLAAFLQPSTPTRYFNSPSGIIVPDWLPFKGLANWWSHRIYNQLFFRMVFNTVNECRVEVLQLPPVDWSTYARLDVSSEPIIYGFSEHIIPRPPDWGDWLHITGYWFLDSDPSWKPSENLLRFLDAGDAPIYVGFGSMVDKEAEVVTRLVVEALQLAGKRGVLLGGWSDLGAGGLPQSILKVAQVPHDWLFPRMAALVHHGGAGTTAAGLRAGIPAVVVPFFADQPFWAQQVYAWGVGPRPIPRQKLTAEKLAAAIKLAVDDQKIHTRAQELAVQIRAENGVSRAVQWIEHYLTKGSD